MSWDTPRITHGRPLIPGTNLIDLDGEERFGPATHYCSTCGGHFNGADDGEIDEWEEYTCNGCKADGKKDSFSY